MNYPFCGLEEETVDHLLWKCGKINPCWDNLMNRLGLSPYAFLHFGIGAWLTNNFGSHFSSSWAKVVIATVAWLICKQRCNLIFRKSPVNFKSIVPRA